MKNSGHRQGLFCAVVMAAFVLMMGMMGGCKGKFADMPTPSAPPEYYYVTDSFETIYRALIDPSHTDIDRYNIWAAYRGNKVKWAAMLYSAEKDKGSVKAIFAFVYDKDKGRLLGGAEALFEGKEGERLLKVVTPSRRVVFEGILTSYYYTESGGLIISLTNARVVDE